MLQPAMLPQQGAYTSSAWRSEMWQQPQALESAPRAPAGEDSPTLYKQGTQADVWFSALHWSDIAGAHLRVLVPTCPVPLAAPVWHLRQAQPCSDWTKPCSVAQGWRPGTATHNTPSSCVLAGPQCRKPAAPRHGPTPRWPAPHEHWLRAPAPPAPPQYRNTCQFKPPQAPHDSLTCTQATGHPRLSPDTSTLTADQSRWEDQGVPGADTAQRLCPLTRQSAQPSSPWCPLDSGPGDGGPGRRSCKSPGEQITPGPSVTEV